MSYEVPPHFHPNPSPIHPCPHSPKLTLLGAKSTTRFSLEFIGPHFFFLWLHTNLVLKAMGFLILNRKLSHLHYFFFYTFIPLFTLSDWFLQLGRFQMASPEEQIKPEHGRQEVSQGLEVSQDFGLSHSLGEVLSVCAKSLSR